MEQNRSTGCSTVLTGHGGVEDYLVSNWSCCSVVCTTYMLERRVAVRTLVLRRSADAVINVTVWQAERLRMTGRACKEI